MSLPSLLPGRPDININPYTYDVSYSGNVYAFFATGGYTMDQCFNTIKILKSSELVQYDVTQAVQVRFDVRIFNAKLGLYKDDANQYITYSSFDISLDRFEKDEITLTHGQFVNGQTIQGHNLTGMTASQVISVGTYNTMYKDYIEFVNTYFGYAGGFSTLFSQASEFDINQGVFDANSFINIINPYTDPSGENVKELTGSITISNINELLRYAVDANIFNNRRPTTSHAEVNAASGNPGAYDVSGEVPILEIVDASGIIDVTGNGTAADICGNVISPLQGLYKSNYGVADGFVAGDLIFIPEGTTISLHLDIDAELYSPLNNIGATNVLGLISSQDFTRKYGTTSQYLFKEHSTATNTNIDRVLKAPLLIKLDNLSSVSQSIYTNKFIDANGLPINHYMLAPYRQYRGGNNTISSTFTTESSPGIAP
jgi:hypothetical protein